MIKIFLLIFMFLMPVNAHALSEEMQEILKLDEEECDEAIEELREGFNEALGESNVNLLCQFSTTNESKTFRDLSTAFSEQQKDIEQFSVGEFIYLSDCSYGSWRLNAFETNIHPKNTNLYDYDADSVSPLTQFMIDELGPLLKLKGLTGLTPLEFVDEQIDRAYQNDSESLAGVYFAVKQAIQNGLRALNPLLETSYSFDGYSLKCLLPQSELSVAELQPAKCQLWNSKERLTTLKLPIVHDITDVAPGNDQFVLRASSHRCNYQLEYDLNAISKDESLAYRLLAEECWR